MYEPKIAQPTDAVSREAVLELAKKGILVSNDNYKCVVNAIKSLPSVTPQRPKGKWIEVFVKTPNDPYSYGFKAHKCSKCEHRPLRISNYCPNCGAEMNRGEEE